MSLFDKNDISTELHLAANKPREDVTVFVVTTRSKCKLPIFNFSFQPVVPKVKYGHIKFISNDIMYY